ncbi:MAG: outer membrane lipoprotein LolB [Candidatus Methylopumilus sp.]|nr:outer membrane lipoprotein LolB [Candidatus Methylopumilus sp.]
MSISKKLMGLRSIFGLIFAVALIGLSGCATQPVGETAPEGSLLRNGRFAVKTEQANQAPEAIQGGFVWRDTPAQLTLDLTNPFGSILARVTVTSAGAMLERANGEILQTMTPDSLIDQALGQSLPVQGLRAWLRTQQKPQPGMRVLERDAQGRIVSFEQDGWSARLSNFDALGPRLVSLLRSETGRKMSVRLVVD